MKEIIPAIDLMKGKVVRLYKGKRTEVTTYSSDPIEVAENLFKHGFQWLHIINLDGALTGDLEENENYAIILELLSLANEWGVKVQLGGGLRSYEDISFLLSAGTERVILGTLAFENEVILKRLVEEFADRIVVALDVSENDSLCIEGWKTKISENIIDALHRFECLGVKTFLVTDTQRDGTIQGSNLKLYSLLQKYKNEDTHIISAGGIGSKKDIEEVLSIVDSVVVGKALYENKLTLDELEQLILHYVSTYLTKRIIPCLDVKKGLVVKGVNFKDLKISGHPVELAHKYDASGADELVFLDISATIEGRKSMLKVISEVAEEVGLPFTVGGGIKSLEDMTSIIQAGAEKVCINTAAYLNPLLISAGAKQFGSQSIVVAIDAKKNSTQNFWEVVIRAGNEPTGKDVIEFAKEVVELGAGELLVTSIDHDGTKEGYNEELLIELVKSVNVPIIISGGAGKKEHFLKAINNGADATLAASLFHLDKLQIEELKNYLLSKGVKMRIETDHRYLE